jgi:hypothetical protein
MSSQLKILHGTKYPKGVKTPLKNPLHKTHMLKSGSSNKKLGGFVRKGMWAKLPIFSLTLEERATCPLTCQQWDNCYGNNMPFAHRFNHTHDDFLPFLGTELNQLNSSYPDGFVIRLHVLGDFFSAQYIKFWALAMSLIDQLRVFGYTHLPFDSPMGQQIQALNIQYPTRWRVRFSDSLLTQFNAHVVADAQQVQKNQGIICPEQLGKAKSCGDCAYCWHSDKPVYFLEH